MIDYMQKGGPLMWLILFCSVLSGAVFLERVLYFHRVTVRVGEFMRGLSNLIQHRRFAEAQMECASLPTPVTRVIHAAILRHDSPRTELKQIVEEAGQLEVPRLERRLGLLATIGFVTPLIGLLGTIIGLIEAFVNISSQSGFASSTEIASGIYQSLLTTAAGLVVSIPCAVAYSYLSARVNSVMHDMERAGIEIVNLIIEHRLEAAPEIIEFGPAGGEVKSQKSEVRSKDALRAPDSDNATIADFLLGLPTSDFLSLKLTRTLKIHPALFNVVPLINVLFLVIVFFALSSRFVLQPGMAITLPVSGFTLGPQRDAKIVSVTAAPVPSIYFRDRKVTVEELREQLTSNRGKERSLIIKADRGTPFDLVAQIMNEGLKLGFSVVLATSPEAP